LKNIIGEFIVRRIYSSGEVHYFIYKVIGKEKSKYIIKLNDEHFDYITKINENTMHKDCKLANKFRIKTISLLTYASKYSWEDGEKI